MLSALAKAYGPNWESGGFADLGNTATIRFNLPENVTMTSGSGEFLADVTPGAVPEPASWAMMIAGFAATGLALRRRRAKEAHRLA